MPFLLRKFSLIWILFSTNPAKYFNSLVIPDPWVGPGVSLCPLYEHEIETKWRRGSREHQAPLIGHNGGQTPFITDQIFWTIFHSLRTWNMNNVNCAFWGVKLINILRFIVNDRFRGWIKSGKCWGLSAEDSPRLAGSCCINIVHLMVWLIECCI